MEQDKKQIGRPPRIIEGIDDMLDNVARTIVNSDHKKVGDFEYLKEKR